MASPLHSLIVRSIAVSIGLLIAGCSGVTGANMDQLGVAAPGPASFNGAFVDDEPQSLWVALTGHASTVADKGATQVRIVDAQENGFVAVLIVADQERCRQRVRCRFEGGHYVSGEIPWMEGNGAVNTTGTYAFGLALDRDNRLVARSSSKAGLYITLIPAFASDSGIRIHAYRRA